MGRMSVILWDLDGCLIDSRQPIVSALEAGFEAIKVAVDRSQLAATIGKPLTSVFSSFVNDASDEDLKAFVDTFRREYNFNIKTRKQLRPYGGIPELLAFIRDSDTVQAVVTAKPYGLVRDSLDAAGILEFFETDRNSDSVPDPHYFGGSYTESRTRKAHTISHALRKLRKLDIRRSGIACEPNTIFMVGDRSSDVDAAIDNGITPLGVTWGFGTKQELQDAGVDGAHLFASPKALHKFFSEVLSERNCQVIEPGIPVKTALRA